MLDKEEKKVLEEVERWQASKFKAGIMPEVVDTVFYPIDRLVEFVIPDKFIEKACKPMEKVLKNLLNSSQRFVNVDSIIKKANDAGLPVKDLEDLRKIPIAYLEVLARSLLEKNAIYAALQGVGLRNYILGLVDLPILFTVNLKMIFQIGACYGYVPDSIKEKEFALRVFSIVSSTGSEQNEEFQKMDELVNSFINGTFLDESSILATDKETTDYINRQIRSFVKRRATRRFPVVGMVLGSGFNYLYAREVAIYAHMLYRKRFLKERGLSKKR